MSEVRELSVVRELGTVMYLIQYFQHPRYDACQIEVFKFLESPDTVRIQMAHKCAVPKSILWAEVPIPLRTWIFQMLTALEVKEPMELKVREKL